MRTIRLAFPALLVFVVLLAGCSSGLVPEPGGGSAMRTGPVEGALAPDLALPGLDGELVTLSDLRGRPVLLNFWTTWCAFCREERAALQQAHEQYSENGLSVLAVAIGEDPTLLENFVEEQGLTYAIVLDSDARVSREYRVRGIPASFFIDREGVIQVSHVGALSEELIQ
jgi:peroxiredoxin